MSIVAQSPSHRGEIAELFIKDAATLLLVTLCALSLRPHYDQRVSAATVLFKKHDKYPGYNMYNGVKSRRQFCDTFLDTLLKRLFSHCSNSLVPRYLRKITREGATFIWLSYMSQWNMEND